jgi:AcrR family transcriptional regulator
MRADAALNRRRLILAARDAVAEQGLGVGVRAIADRAGVGITTLYRHFPEKQQLIDGLSIYRWATMARLADRYAAAASPLPAVVSLLDTFTRMVTADDAFILAADLRIGRTPSGIQPHKAHFDPLFEAMWAAAQRSAQIRAHADRRDALELAGMIRDAQRRTHMLSLLINGICTDTVDAERLLAGCSRPPARL